MLKIRGMFLAVTVCLLTVGCATFRRPQEPKPPLPYLEEEVIFENGSDHTLLHGTLAVPNGGSGRYPAVILVSGSGPTNRNEEYLAIGHSLSFQTTLSETALQFFAMTRDNTSYPFDSSIRTPRRYSQLTLPQLLPFCSPIKA
jgi:hypothetical protein